jgi:hypothetical protein
MMDTENTPTSFYTLTSNQADEQSLDSTVSTLVIRDQFNISLKSMFGTEYNLASTHSFNSYSRYVSLGIPSQRLL